MENPEGESSDGALRLDFDRCLRLEFHGSQITFDPGLLAYRELDAALGLISMAGDLLADARTGRKAVHDILYNHTAHGSTGASALLSTSR